MGTVTMLAVQVRGLACSHIRSDGVGAIDSALRNASLALAKYVPPQALAPTWREALAGESYLASLDWPGSVMPFTPGSVMGALLRASNLPLLTNATTNIPAMSMVRES
eukprot:7834262-Pyramimonas_sp.AAC.2